MKVSRPEDLRTFRLGFRALGFEGGVGNGNYAALFRLTGLERSRPAELETNLIKRKALNLRPCLKGGC